MLGEVYITTALAIFIAMAGWGDILFGLSRSIKEKESEFVSKTKLTYKKYIELKKIISNPSNDPIKYSAAIMEIADETNLKGHDKIFLDILKKTGKHFASAKRAIDVKKIFFLILFLFLFIGGTLLIIFENSLGSTQLVMQYNYCILISQSLLSVMMIIGGIIYFIENRANSNINNNLNELMMRLTE